MSDEPALAVGDEPQKRKGRINESDIKKIMVRSDRSRAAVYDVLWACADLGYAFVKKDKRKKSKSE